MARKEVIQYIDDLDGTPLNEDDVKVVRFGYQGRNYYLDLSADNAAKFDEVLRLKQITGLAEAFKDEEFSKSWEPVYEDEPNKEEL